MFRNFQLSNPIPFNNSKYLIHINGYKLQEDIMNNSKVVREIYTKVKENGKPTIARLRQIKKFDEGGKTIVIDSKITEVAKVCDTKSVTSSVCLLSEYPEKSFTSILFKKLRTNAEISHSGHTFSSETQVNHTTVCGEKCDSSELRWSERSELESPLERCGSSDIRLESQQSRTKCGFVSTKSSYSPVTTTCCTQLTDEACTTTETVTQSTRLNPIADQDVQTRRNEIKKKIQQVINLLRVKPLMPMRQRVEYYRQSSASSSSGSSSNSNYSSAKVRRTKAITRSKQRHPYNRHRDSSNRSQDSCFMGTTQFGNGNSTDSGENSFAHMRDSMISNSKNSRSMEEFNRTGSDDYFSESVQAFTAFTPSQSEPISQSGPFSQSELSSEIDPISRSDPITQSDSISQCPTAQTDTLVPIDEISQMNETNHRAENTYNIFLGDGDGCMTHSSSNKSQNTTSASGSTIDLTTVSPSSDGDGPSLEKKLKKIIAVLVRNVCSEKVIGDGLENIDKINMNVQFSFHKNDEIKENVSAILG